MNTSNKSLVKVNKGWFISEAYEELANRQKGARTSAQIKTLRMFGVVGITDTNEFQRAKNFLCDLSLPICYSEKKGLIWVREVGEALDRLFSGLSKFS